jgi:tetratricopeptide (TPR) repeat protein
MVPKAETVKSRSLSGRAYIGFPVNETVIYPEFQKNLEELAKIRATIDSVRNDSDVTIYAMSIKGFASPESPYDNNARLASGRTQAVKQYVNELYGFAPEFISTSYEPEDWEGLRRFVENSSIPHKKEILAIIDSDREPDNKEWKIKSEYKDDYRYLLDNCYPYLRHSDYVVEYVVRSYADPDEIGRIMMERPQNLSLNEFYVYAQTLEQGSPEFIEVFETAVRMYPRDEAANLNAANTAMSRGDFISALRYLDKAGNSPETIYASGVCAYLSGYMDHALELMKKARDLGVGQAAEVIEVIENKK